MLQLSAHKTFCHLSNQGIKFSYLQYLQSIVLLHIVLQDSFLFLKTALLTHKIEIVRFHAKINSLSLSL